MQGAKVFTLAIVGARTFDDKALFEDTLASFVDQHGMPAAVVSGGAKGADTMAEQWAKKHGIKMIVLKPKWKDSFGQYDPGAGLKRNTDIVNACTHMIAFPSKKGRGTQDSIKKAKDKGVEVVIKWCE